MHGVCTRLKVLVCVYEEEKSMGDDARGWTVYRWAVYAFFSLSLLQALVIL